MFFLKKGFTLAEVLVALAVVGFAVALTVPMLANSAQKHQAGPILGRAVSQIEQGCQSMLQFANQNKMDASFTDVLGNITEKDIGFSEEDIPILASGNFARILALFCNIDDTELPVADLLDIKAFNNSANNFDNTRVSTATRFAFKNMPAHVAVFQIVGGIPFRYPNDPIDRVIYIDTNGWDKGPNVTGKDVFAFQLLNSGGLVPATGSEAGDYAKEVVKDKFKITYY